MTLTLRSLIPGGLMLTASIMAIFSAGCSSEGGPGRHGGARGHRAPPPTPMAGKDTFFDGRIIAELSVGAGVNAEGQPEDSRGGKAGSDRPSKHGGGGMSMSGGMGGGGGGMGGGGMGGGGRGDGPPPDMEQGGRGGGEGMRPVAMEMGPPVMIHLRFTNTGADRVELRLVDFSSPLGNFAVQPDKLTLEPGQSLETEPMSSQLAGSLAELDATLALRIADKTEKKIVKLHALPAAAQPAGPPPVQK